MTEPELRARPPGGALAALVEELRDERDRLLAELAHLQKDEHELSEDLGEPRDELDVSTAQREIDREQAVAARTARRLDAIQAALERAAQGRLGVCERCGAEIGVARLRAMPEAAVCAECAEELRRHGYA